MKLSANLEKDSPSIRKFRRGSITKKDFMMQIFPSTIETDDSPSKQKKQKTILNIKEVEDNDRDYLKMELAEFRRIKKEEAKTIYSKLVKMTEAVFSGNVDPQVNKLCFRKVMDANHN